MTQSNTRTVGITGAQGYLGGVIQEALREDGWKTVQLVRRPPSDLSNEWRFYDSRRDFAPGLLDGLDALVHCAYDMKARRWSEIQAVNIKPTRNLLAAAQHIVPRVVVLSSMSAYEGTSQLYGTAKLAIERDALAAGASVIRPGLVYGKRAGGMAATLARLARLPVSPAPSGDPYQFTVQEEDLAAVVTALLARDQAFPSPLGVAHPEPVPFRDIVARFGQEAGRSPRFLPVPWKLLYGSLVALEALRIPLPVRSDSILGLIRPAPLVANYELVKELGVSLRSFPRRVEEVDR
ncbi:NAD(P)-dependent oxidoreductase [Frankia sp. QA3]|uniref:NAD-dependent epimerase/dehydratase family protein n=1 Tax=Frankia sp. QA3 TaxID=710111 RepID=UPI000269CD78|nr:NAD-dependent epimerase/dehydratase family protein [Frankia sp. QA3]EIV95675.1 NAD dependent epimerase/dehydratase family protein [Frankia sp. QA3]